MGFLKGFDLGKLKDTVGDVAKTAQEGLASIDVKEIGKSVSDAAMAAKSNLESIDVSGIAQGAKDLAASGAATVTSAIENLIGKEEEEPISFRELISLLWCLAHVDGVISSEEKEKITELARSLDENYNVYSAELEQECSKHLAIQTAEFGAQTGVKIEAQRIIESMKLSERDAKLLCWNLLAVAASDGLDEKELDFVRYASERAGVDATVFEELRNYSCAIVEIDKERQQLRASDRPFGVIEPLMNELADREQIIIQAAQALITDN